MTNHLQKPDGTFVLQQADANGNALVSPQGGVGSGAPDSGNPVKVGGKYNLVPPTLADGQRGDLQLDSAGNVKVAKGTNGYPVGSTPVHADSGNGAAAAVAATMAAVAGKTNYLTGFEVTGGGATAASLVDVTVTGLLGGTETYVLGVVAGAAAPNAPLVVRFDPPIPASAVNTAIAVNVPSLGAGNLKARAQVHGFVM